TGGAQRVQILVRPAPDFDGKAEFVDAPYALDERQIQENHFAARSEREWTVVSGHGVVLALYVGPAFALAGCVDGIENALVVGTEAEIGIPAAAAGNAGDQVVDIDDLDVVKAEAPAAESVGEKAGELRHLGAGQQRFEAAI